MARIVRDSAWFAMSSCQAGVATPAGTRAGNPLGDLLFYLAFAPILRAVRAKLVPAGLVAQLPDALRPGLLLANNAAAGGGTMAPKAKEAAEKQHTNCRRPRSELH